MAKPDYSQLAAQIVEGVGGAANVSQVTHCMTRLRLKLKNSSKAHKVSVEKLPGVITVMEAGGQFQVVIGDNVPLVYEAVGKIPGITTAGEVEVDDNEDAPKENLFNRFIAMISAIFSPILWTLAGISLIKAFLSMAATFSWIDTEGTTYAILNALSDSVLYFLPMFLAITAAKYFKANQFTAMAIAGALLYPSIVALAGQEGVTFFGIPVVMMSYVSSVIPILFAVWIQGHWERLLNRVLPAMIRNFTTPLLSALVMVPLTLIVVGPLTTIVANAISGAVTWAFGVAPWLAGAIMGGLWQVFVMFGLHWGFIPVMANDIATQGYSLLSAPIVVAVLAQAAAALAVAIRTRSKARREVAIPGTISGFLAGITEPVIYGVNLPMKRPFYFGIAGGAVGGIVAALGGSAANAFVVPSLLALPAYTSIGSFPMLMLGILVGVLTSFFLTLFFGVTKQNDIPDEILEVAEVDPATAVAEMDELSEGVAGVGAANAASATATAVMTGTKVKIAAPIGGKVVPLEELSDKVFASGTLGNGVGIVPNGNVIHSPVSGTVLTAFKTGHAYGIKTDDGVEVLIHIGVDTVSMKGDGFTAEVAAGDRVSVGDRIATVDFSKVKDAGYDSTTIVLITNTKKLAGVAPVGPETVKTGEDIIDVEV